ncbi:MAG: ribonuclease P protein component [Actinomycetes bacterium]
MLPAGARLRRRDEFAATLSQGRRGGGSRGAGLLVTHLASTPAGGTPAGTCPRVGFVVSRAVGSAVARNRVRRRLRHLMAERLVLLPERSRLVVRARPGAASAGFPELERALDAALRASGVRGARS